MFEPLLFFVLTYSDNILGVPLSVSRILQIIVLLLLVSTFFRRVIYKKQLIIINNIFPENQYLVFYILWLILASFIGIFLGSYNLPRQVNIYDFDGINPYLYRSIFEYIILLFNIFYFALLPRHLIKTKKDFDYLFSVFKFFLIITLVVGYADYILTRFEVIDLVSRHIRDGVNIGARFHGLGGEPRQAAVHMVFNTSMYILYCHYLNVNIKIPVIFFLILSLILTTSMSLFIGVIFFCFFLFVFRIIKFKYIFVLLSIIISMLSMDYVQNYKNYLMDAWQIFESGDELPYFLRILRGELYPLHDIIKKIQNFELITVFFGNGLGSVSAVNNIYIGEFVKAILKIKNIQFI